jgi:hypothetical protein
MRLQPIVGASVSEAGDVDAVGAVPHRSEHSVNAPWAPPGRYTVRLSVGARKLAQPLVLRLDPRVKTPALGLAQLAALTREMYAGAAAAHTAYLEARAMVAAMDSTPGGAQAALRTQVESLAPAPRPRARGFFRRGAAESPTLESASNGLLAAAMAMQGADLPPTAAQVAACDRARTQAAAVMARWARLRPAGGTYRP